MKVPNFELIERTELKKKELVPKPKGSICNGCEQRIEKVDGRYKMHTRRVFREMIPSDQAFSGQPRFVVEVCPNGIGE